MNDDFDWTNGIVRIYGDRSRPVGTGFVVSKEGRVVTGPRRAMLRGFTLWPYFAAPYGDVMIAGCFGLLAATADVLPELGQTIHAPLNRDTDSGTALWELDY